MIAVPALVIRRVYDAPVHRVYSAWTDPTIACRFMGPGDVRCEILEMNVVKDGTYALLMHSDEDMTVRGRYVEVVPDRKLVMTWRWEEDKPEDEYDTLLTLEFNPLPEGTEFILTHEQFATEQSRGNHEGGWTKIVDALGGVLKP